MEDRLLTALVELEYERQKLHDALRQAHFLLGSTQRTEDSRGHLLGLESFPIDEGTLTPLITIDQTRQGCAASQTAKADSVAQLPADWTVSVRKGDAPPPSLAPAKVSADVENAVDATTDPLFYISSAPSMELRSCQGAYQDVVKKLVAVANAQARVLQLAEQLAQL